MRDRLPLLFIFVLAVAAHVDSLTYWFTTTDTLPLIETSRVRTAGDLVGLFVNPLMHGSDFVQIALFWRPVASLTYALDYALWGLNPMGYQATNLVLHGGAAVLAAVAIAEATGRPRAGHLTGALLAIHPLTVEAVPTAARRQDVLMSVFFLGALALFIRSRRDGSRRLLGLALVAYALALGSKELAVILPAVVFAWVGLQRLPESPVAAFRAAVETVIPFAAVTVGYLIARIAVLEGLGGYLKDNPLSFTEAAFVPVKYVLWVAHPVNVVEVVVASFSPTVALPAVGLALLVVVPFGVGRFDRPVSPAALAFLLFVVGLGSIPLLLAHPTRVESWLHFEHPDVVVGYLVGLVFVGSCVAGALSAMAASDSRFGPALAEPLAFLGLWLVLPLALFLISDNLTLRPFQLGHSSHNSYLFVVPAMAIPALLAVTAAREASWGAAWWDLDANAALVGVIALLLLPVVAASPLVHPYDDWEVSGDVNEQTLTGLTAELESEPDGTTVVVEGLPDTVREDRSAYPRAQSVTPMRKHTVDAWLRLRYPDRDFEVVIDHTRPLPREPHTIAVDRMPEDGDAVRVRISATPTDAEPSEADAPRLPGPARPAWLAPHGIR